MGHQFEDALETEVDATVDEVWQAIATGPGIDSWFMGRNSVADGIEIGRASCRERVSKQV